MKRVALLMVWVLILHSGVFSQINRAELQQILSSSDRLHEMGFSSPEKLMNFYQANGYQLAWFNRDKPNPRLELCAMLTRAEYDGLDPSDFMIGTKGDNVCAGIISTSDTLLLELQTTDAALRYFSAIASGYHKPAFEYEGLDYSPNTALIPSLLWQAITTNGLNEMKNSFNNAMPVIPPLLREIAHFLELFRQKDFTDEKIVSTKVSVANKALCKKLFALGCTDSLLIAVPDSLVKRGVKKAQEKFDQLSDGILRSTTMEELNRPLRDRLSRLNIALDYYRWLYGLTKNDGVIVVNIPAAHLKVYQEGKVAYEMKLIVGKPSTGTPTLTSRVNEVILYPYWVVPSSIITNEILPKLRNNPGYIDANNFQVIDGRGKVVNPYSVNWNAVSASHFPYMIRQSTGCDNALGLIKLNFYNPFTVYLHDTPNKTLFMTRRRYYSHGCMRMEKPLELGHLVLGSNGIAIDTLEEKGCLKNQAPIPVPAERRLAVVVWYNPVDINDNGALVYYEDIYKKLGNGAALLRPRKN